MEGRTLPVRVVGTRPSAAFRAFLVTGKIFVALVSTAVLLVTSYGWNRLRTANDGIVKTEVISEELAKQGPKPLDGAVDILLVGMDSRTDAQGNPLSEEVLAMLNGGIADGEQNTDTMILVHIPVDGTRAVAISFPRDSYVEMADGFGKHKLNSAFARQRNTIDQQLRSQGVTDEARIRTESMAAGRKTLIKTIENMTGGSVRVDRYAEVNLASFYEVTKAIGGVEVCLKEPTSDRDSGANFQAGQQTIEGAAALSFVRQRKNLPGGDLDRIVRQQVFIGALAKKVLSTGTLTDPGKLNGLVEAVQKSVILSSGWDITTFAEQMQGLVGGNFEFKTIPVGDPTDTYSDGNVLPVNPAQVRKFLTDLASDKTSKSPSPTTTTSLPAPPNSSISVQVHNAAGRQGLAAQVLDMLVDKGFKRGSVASAQETSDNTVVFYAAGEEGSARKVAAELGPDVGVSEEKSVRKGQVLVYLGTDYQSQGDDSEDVDPQGVPDTSTAASSSSTPPITAGGLVCVN
ncbi:cell envelope-related function transcriptional attenuator common domain-containing protein [Lentzea waywayandensis]|uniref:Cell envelope-related function transcriptional attenuator common domain-containing protein n=1 Tax=Lentzea waywayandensis TaxID=84724 RepID=A0A1I6DX97_9PSEU|nr:LCP family protein [Lentzea waywayandensis]SFR10134.1 cell envelope-related function transcriptional attenuator common domain-containing protein [Lentzea waywayandensis]